MTTTLLEFLASRPRPRRAAPRHRSASAPTALVHGARIAAAIAMRAALKATCGLRVTGIENLPTSGSFVIVANHASHLDTLALLSMFPVGRLDRVFPLAARDYFDAVRLRGAVTRVAFNILAFERNVPACRTFDRCRALLASGTGALIVYPEGTRSVDGSIGEFKAGIGYVLAGLDVPAIPCFLEGTADAWPKGRRLPRPRAVAIRIGEPRRYAHVDRSKAGARSIGVDLAAAVLELSSEVRR